MLWSVGCECLDLQCSVQSKACPSLLSLEPVTGILGASQMFHADHQQLLDSEETMVQLRHRWSANLQARERFDSRPVMFSERCQWLWLSVAPAGPVPVSHPFRPGTPMQWRLGGSYKYQQRHSYSCRIGYQVATVIKTPVYCQTHTQGRDFTLSSWRLVASGVSSSEPPQCQRDRSTAPVLLLPADLQRDWAAITGTNSGVLLLL